MKYTTKTPKKRISRLGPTLTWWQAVVSATVLVALMGLRASADAPYAGRPLHEVLRELQTHGLEVFFTSNLVRPGLRVTTEPISSDPRRLLEEILAGHGLAVTDGPGGRLVVVLGAQRPAGMEGQVLERYSANPIPRVSLLISDKIPETRSGPDGGFSFPELEPGTYTLEARLPGYVVERREIELQPQQRVEIVLELEPAPIALDEIVVTPSSVSLLREDPVSALDLDRDDIVALPHLGDDIFRTFTLLPGVAGEEASAQFNVRGGRADEVLVLLDQSELFEPYHLKDYSSAVSIIPPQALREVNLMTGGFPAQYGDRMSGVLDMSTVQHKERQMHLGLGILGADAGGGGSFAAGRGFWLGSLRRGFLDLTLEFLGQEEDPRYWDAFGKTEYQWKPNQRVGIHLLHSDDRLDFLNNDPDTREDYRTSYGNSYFWLTHQGIRSPTLFVDSSFSVGQVRRDRRADEVELEEGDEGGFSIFDKRRLDVLGFKQDWSLSLGRSQGMSHYLRWGFEVRRLVTEYDYFNRLQLDFPIILPESRKTRFKQRLEGDQYSVYLSDRIRPRDDLTMELGLRYDEQSLTDDQNLSPRVNLVYTPGRLTHLRLAWGYFFQSQRPYELQVEDGITQLASAERTEQRVIGLEHAFVGRSRAADLLLRVEAYQRLISNPRPRFENLFDPISEFPEIEADRLLFAPQSSEAYGLEISLRGKLGPAEWWANYAYARVKDRIGQRDVPRRFDQPHTFNFTVNLQAGKHWNVNLAWRYHTGWPTTAVSAVLLEGSDDEDDEEDGEDEEGRRTKAGDDDEEFGITLGPIHGERLSPYHRLDLRASREWERKSGLWRFFLEIQNVYDRGNIAGFDVEFDFDVNTNGEISVVPQTEIWGGFRPSFGLVWEF